MIDEDNFDDYLDEIIDPIPVESEDDISNRDKQYTRLVGAYADYYSKKTNANFSLRKWFFGLSFALVGLLIGGLITVCVILCLQVNNNVAILSGIISSIVGLITSVLALPTIIGGYLFPKDEDKYIRDMICDMKKTDEQRRSTKAQIDFLKNKK